MSLRCALIALSVLSGTKVGVAQLSFSDSSRLSTPDYREQYIKNITDENLFGSLRLDRPELNAIQTAVRRGDSAGAYQAWGAYWGTKQQPRYITYTYRQLLDTDLLMDYDDLRAYISHRADEKDTILARAGLVLRNIIHTWGDAVIDFGSLVDFDREIGRSGKYGFHYWGWSRPLNSAYVITGEEKYLAKFDELFNRWYEQRNSITRGFPELDVVYYELGLGIRNRMFIEYYMLPYAGRPWYTHERMLKTVLGAARWLYELERCEGYRSGNWQIHGSYMLVQIALTFPEFRESPEWLRMGLQRLEEHRERDFFADGGHSERSPRNYTLATYLSYRNLYFLLTAHKTRDDIARNIQGSMGWTIDWWITMLAPTGEIPAINDSHRGLFPAFVLRDGAEFFQKPEVYSVLKSLFGTEQDSVQAAMPLFASRHMPASGFTIMRTDWTRDALYMNINYGKWNGAHTHSDLLDFEIYGYGKALAVDAGIGLTYDDPLYIPWYKSSRAHNMVVVNDRNMERETVEGENILWSSTPSLDYFAGEHRGYAHLGVHHRRHIAFVKPDYWVVLDRLKCESADTTLSWYFHSPTSLLTLGQGFRSSSAPGIIVLPATDNYAVRTGVGMAASTRDLMPGKTQPINWIAFDQPTGRDAVKQFVVLLYPFRTEKPSVRFDSVTEEHFALRTSRGIDDLYFPHDAFEDDLIATDASFLLLRRELGQPTRYYLVNGTYLRSKSRSLWQSDQKSSAEGTLPE